MTTPSGIRSVLRRPRRLLATAAAAALAAPLLAACGSSNSGGPVTINFYNFPDSSGAIQAGADSCTKSSGGKYKLVYNKLPSAADAQRQQLVRRLAARDTSVDILGLDVTWEAEFSEAGWIVPWTGQNEQAVRADTIDGPLETAIWKGKLVAAPYNSNTQLLWYRSDLVPKPPTTWDQMISMAEQLNKQGKPHYIEIQGAQYEGLTVWFNSLVASGGGSILNATSTAPSLGPPALKAMEIMHNLATSPAADPSLSTQMEDQNRLRMEAGVAAFEINYPFVWPSMQEDKPPFYKSFKYTTYPTSDPSHPAKSTIGGIDLAISTYSQHKDLAFQAALCLRNKQNQLTGAIKGGLPPTLKSIYTNPPKDFVAAYPFYKLIYKQLQNAAVRPKTPAYQSVSIAISHSLSPPSGIDPPTTLKSLQTQLSDALASKGLIP